MSYGVPCIPVRNRVVPFGRTFRLEGRAVTSSVVDVSAGRFAAGDEVAGIAGPSAFVRSGRRAGSSVAEAPRLSGQWTTISLPSRSKNDKSILANSLSGYHSFSV